jgi:hypothetical protein
MRDPVPESFTTRLAWPKVGDKEIVDIEWEAVKVSHKNSLSDRLQKANHSDRSVSSASKPGA